MPFEFPSYPHQKGDKLLDNGVFISAVWPKRDMHAPPERLDPGREKGEESEKERDAQRAPQGWAPSSASIF